MLLSAVTAKQREEAGPVWPQMVPCKWKQRFKVPDVSRCKESEEKGQTQRVSSNWWHDGWHILILHLPLNTTGNEHTLHNCYLLLPKCHVQIFPQGQHVLALSQTLSRTFLSEGTFVSVYLEHEYWRTYRGNPPIPPINLLLFNPLWGFFDGNNPLKLTHLGFRRM